jgi:SPP1 family predicted phage head-tail adaptor
LYFSDRITLRAVTSTLTNGIYVDANTDTEVWADKRSVKRQEFYSALAAGRSADIVFGVHADDYSNQSVVVYNNLIYKVLRSYQTSPDEIELTCVRG